MSGFRRRPKKKVIILAAAVLVVSIAAFLVLHYLNSKGTPQVPGTGTSTKPSRNDVGIYLDKGDLWQWVNGRKTQLTKLGTVSTFDWHPAGGELVYLTSDADGSFKLVDRHLASKQELVIQQGTASILPKILCTTNSVLLIEASPTTVARLIQLTVTSIGYDGTTNSSFWTQVPVTKDRFDRTTRLILDGSTPLIVAPGDAVAPGGIWTIAPQAWVLILLIPFLVLQVSHSMMAPSLVSCRIQRAHFLASRQKMAKSQA